MVPNSIYCRKFTIHLPLRILNVTLKMKQEQRILKTNESRLHHLKKNAKMEREKNNNNNYLMFWKLIIKQLKMTKRMLWNTGYNILENTIFIFVGKKNHKLYILNERKMTILHLKKSYYCKCQNSSKYTLWIKYNFRAREESSITKVSKLLPNSRFYNS